MDLSPTLALLIDAVPIGGLLIVLFVLRSRRLAAQSAARPAEAAERDRGARSWERLPRTTERRVTAVDPSERGPGRRTDSRGGSPKK